MSIEMFLPRHEAKDSGVSPVIGVILMVAVTVVLAASVYVWVNSFATGQESPENAQVRAMSFDPDGDGVRNWVRLVLVDGDDAPYGVDVVEMEVVVPNGGVIDNSQTTNYLCETPHTEERSNKCAPDRGIRGSWEVGEGYFLPCQAEGAHQVTLIVRGSTVLDHKAHCEGPANGA